MTEALVSRLSGIHDLRVISRTSSMHLKNSDLSVPEIARTLRADVVVEGSVTREGNRVRVTAQLIRGTRRMNAISKVNSRESLGGACKPAFVLSLADRLSSGLSCLAAGGLDALLLDLCLPDSEGLDSRYFHGVGFSRGNSIKQPPFCAWLNDPASAVRWEKRERRGHQVLCQSLRSLASRKGKLAHAKAIVQFCNSSFILHSR